MSLEEPLLKPEQSFENPTLNIDNNINDNFIIKLYYYYIHKGYYNIISTQVVNILTTLFLFSFIIFLFNCIDYNGLFTMYDTGYLSDYIKWSDFFELDIISWICVIIFLFFIFCKVLSLFDDVKTFYKIKKYYNKKLLITDSQIISIQWSDVLDKIKMYENDDIDIYVISSIIMAKDNYLIALLDNEVIKLSFMTALMEWNLKYCIIHHIFNKNKLRTSLFEEKDEFKKGIQNKLRIVSIFNFICMPLIFILFTFYTIFKYGEDFYNKPDTIFSRNWSLLSKWKYRLYNETYHLFHDRINNSIEPSNNYINQFPNKILETFSKLIVFILSSLFILMLFLTLVNENLLMNLYVTSHRPILWYIGILGTVIAINKKLIKEKLIYHPKKYFNEITEYITLPDDWEDNSDKIEIKQKFIKTFNFQLVLLIKDIFYILMSPFDLWELSYHIDEIVEFISQNTIYEKNVGYICSFSAFRKIRHHNPNLLDKKTFNSFKYFDIKYPDWLNKKNNFSSFSINIIN